MAVIQTFALTRSFPNTCAVDNVSMQVNEGEIYGFLGLNGAGKTTTIRMLLGMVKPTSGTIKLFGSELLQTSWDKTGYLVETPYAYPNLTVEENLNIFFRYRNLKHKSFIQEIIDQLQLTKYRKVKARNLSLGNTQRLGLAKALMHKPKLLILDEPINGLDPAGIVEIRLLLKELSRQGTTIFLSSHILGEISRVASRIGIIHQGKLIRELQTSELESQLVKKLRVKTVDDNKALQVLKSRGLHPELDADQWITLTDKEALGAPEQIASLLVAQQAAPKSIYIYEEDLETFFFRMIGKEEVK